jgi:alpha-galactosidase
MSQIPAFAEVKADGVQLVLSFDSGTPVILHFGADLGANLDPATLDLAAQEAVPHADLDDHINPGIWREDSRGFHGRPALLGHRAGQGWAPLFAIRSVEATAESIEIICHDTAASLEIVVTYELSSQGILKISQSVKNLGTIEFALNELNAWLPLPDHATETMDFTGRWVKERQPQRREIQVGTWAREVREGRSSHDYTIVQLAMTAAANYQNGEVWSVGLEWSGNTRHLVEKLPTGRSSIGAGELLLPGEVILAAGEEYVAPTLVASYSNEGIDGITDRHYRWLRSRTNHPSAVRPRPLTLNVWEAVYFNHNLEKLTQLADVAQSLGVERFVLDDGWFGARRDDRRGLGDWIVSKDVWPNGLKPLIDAVNSRGMEFGLWFEGEMVNPDSDFFRDHPDWILHIEGRTPPEGRFQQVVDLTHQGAFDHVLGQVDAVLSEYDIAYIKWDHNRTLTDSAHFGQAAVREQTKAIYRLFDELKRRHPGLEIESCASGGGRIDLGMVNYADRFWTSDCNDALERQFIQRYTQFVIPPEMLGSHIGPTESHTTHRTHSLQFRAITALFGHAGLEWDLTQTTDEERAQLKSWASYYKANRSLIHSGRMVRIEQPDDSAFVHGVVAQDKSRAIFALVALRGMPSSTPNALRFEGLDAESNYRVRLVEPAGSAHYIGRRPPQWLDGVVLTGAALARVGVRPPILAPETAVLFELDLI